MLNATGLLCGDWQIVDTAGSGADAAEVRRQIVNKMQAASMAP